MAFNLHEEGKLGDYLGRPLLSIKVNSSYILSFANLTLSKPMSEMNFVQIDGDTENVGYEENLDLNLPYDRVFHFWINDPTISTSRFGPYYVPYIDEIKISKEGKKTYHVKPLREVINPRIMQLSKGTYCLFFFTNFSTNQILRENSSSASGKTKYEYTDDPLKLVRNVEFASNQINKLTDEFAPPSDIPLDNTFNYYPHGDESLLCNSRTALVSCILRIVPLQISDEYEKEGNKAISSSSGASRVKRNYVICEKPVIVEWMNQSLSQDTYPSFLVNRAQEIEWKNVEDLDDSAIGTVPSLQVPEHHLVNGVETKMYPGKIGFDFDTFEINKVYKDSLNYVLEMERVGDILPHDPEYALFYDNFRSDGDYKVNILSVKWKTERSPSIEVSRRKWDHSVSSYANSTVTEKTYPYEGSNTDTYFVALSIKYEIVRQKFSYDVLKYVPCCFDCGCIRISAVTFISWPTFGLGAECPSGPPVTGTYNLSGGYQSGKYCFYHTYMGSGEFCEEDGTFIDYDHNTKQLFIFQYQDGDSWHCPNRTGNSFWIEGVPVGYTGVLTDPYGWCDSTLEISLTWEYVWE